MPKGRKPNGIKYGGRTKGTPNKKTVDALDRAERILQLIENEYFEKDIKALTSSQRMTLYSEMMEYRTPKLSRREVSGSVAIDLTTAIIGFE